MRTQWLIRLCAASFLFFAAAGITRAQTLYALPVIAPTAQLYGNCGPVPRCFSTLSDLKRNTAVVGSSGQVSIFARQPGGEWLLTAALLDPFAPLPRPQYNSYFGYLASIDGDMLAVAANPEDKPAPVIYIFKRQQGQWSVLQTIELTRSFGNVELAKLVLNATTLAASRIEYATDGSGLAETKVLLFSEGRDGKFQLQQQLDPAISPDAAYDIAMDATTLALATPGSGNQAGAVYLYRKNDAAEYRSARWRLKQVIQPPLTAASGFGSSMSLSGNMLAVGAPGEISPPPTLYSGAVYIYRQHDERWHLHDRIVDPVIEINPPEPDDGITPAAQDPFGTEIALSKNRLLVKHIIDVSGGFSTSILFERHQGTWSAVARLEDDADIPAGVVQNMLMVGATAWLAEATQGGFAPYLNIYDLPALTVDQSEPVSEP